MRDPGRWWIFQPRGHGRRHLTPIGLTWTLVAYGLLGLGTVEVVRRLAGLEGFPTVGPVLVIQGATDQDVPPAVTQLMVQHLQQLGDALVVNAIPSRLIEL